MTVQFNTPLADLAETATVVLSLGAVRRKSQQGRYGNGAPPQLPSKATVTAIVDALQAALFPRHFGPPELTFEGTDTFVESKLQEALTELREQIRRELALVGGAAERTDAERPRRITYAFAQTLPRVRALLDTDVRAAYAGDPAAKSLDEIIFCYPGVSALIKYRLAHQLYQLRVTMLARIISEIAHSQTGIDIHPGAEIDEGFFIDHGTGVVIGETTRIGKNVRLYQAVTLGAKRFDVGENGVLLKDNPRHPIVEDNVVIYAGATVLGRITIGRGSSIGGNVWLTHSVPPASKITQAKAQVDTFDNGGGI